MRALIVEDELLAQKNLKTIIKNNVSDIEIVDCVDSVKSAVEWFSNGDNSTDVVFMDVELSDGTCFDIFDLVEVDAKIIMTTAFDSYAIKAFKVNSVDYILKPIDPEELVRAIDKCRRALSSDLGAVVELPKSGSVVAERGEQSYKKRFTEIGRAHV